MSPPCRVLIVEDDALIAADLAATLGGYGYAVLGPVSSGEEALEVAASLVPDFILMDIGLAGKLDGVQTAEALPAIVNAPVVFLSGIQDESTLQRAKLVNPYGYLIKPFGGAELHSTIELTLHRFAVEAGQLNQDDKSSTEEFSGISASDNLPSETGDFLASLPMFTSIPPTAVDVLARSTSLREFKGGEFILMEGERASGVFVPISGRISITKTSESGKELIVALLAPRDCFALFYHLPAFSSSSSARTQIASKVIWIPMAQWNDFVTSHPRVYENLANALAERLTVAHALSSSLAHTRVEGRILHTLLALLPNFGKSHDKRGTEDRIFITRKELAELTGTTPETAIRVTRSLEKEGFLDLTRAGIIKIPDVLALRRLSQA